MDDFVHQDAFIYHTEDAVLEIAGQLKCALAQVTFVKPREEL